MPHDNLTASLVLFIGGMQQPSPPSESRQNFEPGVTVISVRPEHASEEILVGRSDEAPALAGGPSQWVLPMHGSFVNPQGAAPPNVFADVHYKSSDVSSLLPRRIVGSSPDTWGQEGDECVICLGAMAAGEHVSDLPACHHTFHLQCAADWLKTRVEAGQLGCCPVCNAEIFRPALNCKTPGSTRWLHEPRLERPSSVALFVFKFFVIICVVIIIVVAGLWALGTILPYGTRV